ncbi:MAG: acyltransferase [Turicibacter sanguinis]|uniref:acyltransferase n=1 Tax=Turicibacter sanguinis TaxID=154288 RepID=UPI003995D9BE
MSELAILIRKIRFACFVSWKKKAKWIVKNNIFYECGEHLLFQPRKLPNDPKLIKIHNNVAVAAEVCFENHDVIHFVIEGMKPTCGVKSHIGCIEIMDNVFIGARSMIMPNVKIGPNVIVAAGSIVTKDIPEGVIVAGVPARVIGSFDELVQRRIKESANIDTWDRSSRIEKEWLKFYEQRNTKS